MAKTIASNLKQAICSRSFLIGAVGVVLVIFLSSIEGILSAFRTEALLHNGFHNQLTNTAITSDAMALALPILCTLPYTSAFVDDIKSGFIKAYLPRTSVGRYITGKSIACAISGGLVLALGILCAYTIAALVFSPMEATLAKGAEAPSYFADLMQNLLLFFCSGVFWSLIGLTFASLTGSKYMAYASPFVLFYLLVILHERYFDKLYIFYPREWLNPSDKWMFGKIGAELLLLELASIAALAFAAVVKRKVAML